MPRSVISATTDADVAPFVATKAGYIPEGLFVVGIVLGQVPRTGTEGVEELHHNQLVLNGFLAVDRIRRHSPTSTASMSFWFIETTVEAHHISCDDQMVKQSDFEQRQRCADALGQLTRLWRSRSYQNGWLCAGINAAALSRSAWRANSRG